MQNLKVMNQNEKTLKIMDEKVKFMDEKKSVTVITVCKWEFILNIPVVIESSFETGIIVKDFTVDCGQ